MSRCLFALIAMLAVTTAAHATSNREPKKPQNIVFKYECDQVDPSLTGFSCHFSPSGLMLFWQKRPKNMANEDRKRALYEFNKIALRYLELGGHSFWIRFHDWPKNKRQRCYPFREHDYTYTCNPPQVWVDEPTDNQPEKAK